MDGRPVVILGVRRSGTTLLRVMLDRNPGIAVPDESYFLPQLAARHRRDPVDRHALCDDLARIRTLRDWGVEPAEVGARLGPSPSLAEGVRAVYDVYAAARNARRFGDKTPMYMQYLPVLERVFPDAQYVHLIRDGRDAATSFLAMPPGITTVTWAHPRSAQGFACEWRTQVRAAKALGRRLGPSRYLEAAYEELAAHPRAALERICDFADLAYDDAMLRYPGAVDVSRSPHQARLAQPPTPGLRDWRREMPPGDVAAFEAVAGDMLAACGYDLADAGAARGPGPRARGALAAYETRAAMWRAAGRAVARSPLWRRRHPHLSPAPA